MGWISCVRCEKFQNDFMAQTCVLIATVLPVLQRVLCSIETLPNAPKHYGTHTNMSLGSNGMDWVCSLQKIQTRLCLTNFCTSSACFAQCFESQPNYPKCTQIVQKTPKRNFRMQWDRVRSLQKISMRLRGNELFALVRSILHRVS